MKITRGCISRELELARPIEKRPPKYSAQVDRVVTTKGDRIVPGSQSVAQRRVPSKRQLKGLRRGPEAAAPYYRVEFADRSPAAGQCAALAAVKPMQLFCEDIQLRALAKRVQSQADLRELWQWVASFQLVGFHLAPRQEPHMPYPTQVNLRLRYSSCAVEEISRSARPRDQFGEPLNLPVQRRIKSGRNREPVSQGVLCDLRLAGCRLGPRASPCVSPVCFSSCGRDQLLPRE